MSTPTDIHSLFQAARSSDTLSTASMQALTIADIGAMIQAGLGTPVDNVTASEAVLVTMMPDDSGSIRFAGNAQVVLGGVGHPNSPPRSGDAYYADYPIAVGYRFL